MARSEVATIAIPYPVEASGGGHFVHSIIFRYYDRRLRCKLTFTFRPGKACRVSLYHDEADNMSDAYFGPFVTAGPVSENAQISWGFDDGFVVLFTEYNNLSTECKQDLVQFVHWDGEKMVVSKKPPVWVPEPYFSDLKDLGYITPEN